MMAHDDRDSATEEQWVRFARSSCSFRLCGGTRRQIITCQEALGGQGRWRPYLSPISPASEPSSSESTLSVTLPFLLSSSLSAGTSDRTTYEGAQGGAQGKRLHEVGWRRSGPLFPPPSSAPPSSCSSRLLDASCPSPSRLKQRASEALAKSLKPTLVTC